MTHTKNIDVIIAGAGAAGVFAAIRIKELNPSISVVILEKSARILDKVRISGGGRCNITNAETNLERFAEAYPRGKYFMRKSLYKFGPADILNWFKINGLETHTEKDGRIFPESNTSASVIHCFTEKIHQFKIDIELKNGLEKIIRNEELFQVETPNNTYLCKALLLCPGGNAIESFRNILNPFGVQFEDPLPSLFTFNTLDKSFANLMGLSAEVSLNIAGTKFQESGPLLITHWGYSGPVVLRCSAFSARELAKKNYNFSIRINWMPASTQDELRSNFMHFKSHSGKRMLRNSSPEGISSRLWEALLLRAGCNPDQTWNEINQKSINKLVETLTADTWEIRGKTTFKEEFVTCGGIKLNDLIPENYMLKKCPGLFAAGEIIDVDGITGGFNFQNAWTGADLAAKGIINYLNQSG
ncbi:MAG: aminoacetone oxidase family FAD-binding enzyme [Bacteroidetes bacterium]|nr:aminoacetone oxidase family FAD-binding enzyme [Bacteroidota bacterium]